MPDGSLYADKFNGPGCAHNSTLTRLSHAGIDPSLHNILDIPSIHRHNLESEVIASDNSAFGGGIAFVAGIYSGAFSLAAGLDAPTGQYAGFLASSFLAVSAALFWRSNATLRAAQDKTRIFIPSA